MGAADGRGRARLPAALPAAVLLQRERGRDVGAQVASTKTPLSELFSLQNTIAVTIFLYSILCRPFPSVS